MYRDSQETRVEGDLVETMVKMSERSIWETLKTFAPGRAIVESCCVWWLQSGWYPGMWAHQVVARRAPVDKTANGGEPRTVLDIGDARRPPKALALRRALEAQDPNRCHRHASLGIALAAGPEPAQRLCLQHRFYNFAFTANFIIIGERSDSFPLCRVVSSQGSYVNLARVETAAQSYRVD
ncbi:hypothetical protein CT0861_04056 [Colletotrichum tofieldiae]|uniref:Uncharacterized protein n=1 Tax=Colletotrichum tofieldiae TaxID=708197 RepID=A0A166PRW7_9PEZI|nr:hypothetical protein CT0861_04056 [Colletotrichum tofieldiae]